MEIDQNVQIWVKAGINCKYIYICRQIWSENWNLRKKWWNLGANRQIDQNQNSKCLKLSAKCGTDQNVKIWEKRESWQNAKVGIDQNDEIWLENKELNRILKLEKKKLGIDENVQIWVLIVKIR